MGIRIPNAWSGRPSGAVATQDDHAYLSLAAEGPPSPATSHRRTKTLAQAAMSVGVPPCPFPVAVSEMEQPAMHRPMLTHLAQQQVERTRCYWAICRCSHDPEPAFSFVYVDPRAHRKVGSALYGAPMLQFVHPDEQPRVMDHMRTIMQDSTLFGRVIQCRYATLTSMPAYLHGVHVPDYDTVDVIVSRLHEQLVVCFFHATEDASHACGLAPGSFEALE